MYFNKKEEQPEEDQQETSLPRVPSKSNLDPPKSSYTQKSPDYFFLKLERILWTLRTAENLETI